MVYHNAPQIKPTVQVQKLSKHQPREYLQAVSIRPDSAHFFYQAQGEFNQSYRHKANQANLQDNDSEGVMSAKAQKRLKQAVMMLLYKTNYKKTTDSQTGKTYNFLINFITLTLPATQTHSDNEIKAVCMNNFLQVMRKEVGLENYVWRAEAQLNGNIHFHLVTDKYIHYKTLRKYWNQSIELLGYVSAFESKFHHRNPPTEEVRAVKHIRNVASYLSKYFSKQRSFVKIGEVRLIKGERVDVLFGSDKYRQEQTNRKEGRIIASIISGDIRRIKGRLWFLSRSLSKCKPIIVNQSEHTFADFEKLIHETDCKIYQSDFVCSYYGKFVSAAKKSKSPIEKVFADAWK